MLGASLLGGAPPRKVLGARSGNDAGAQRAAAQPAAPRAAMCHSSGYAPGVLCAHAQLPAQYRTSAERQL